MPRFILYIINPISGTRTKKDLQAFIEKSTAERKFAFEITHSVPGGDYRFLEPLIREKQVTDIVIAGGDGTVNQVIGSLMHLPVNFGIIPCGSGNGLAYTAGIPKNPAAALDLVFRGTPKPTDGFFVNDIFACMLTGLGFDAKVAHDFAQQPTRGLSTYVKQIFRNFFSAKAWPFHIKLADQELNIPAYFISIANSNQFGNNFRIAPQASLRDGLLDIVIVTDQSKTSFIFNTIKQITGRNKLVSGTLPVNKKGIIYFRTDRLFIENTGLAPMHIDGDPAPTPVSLDIRIHPLCFNLIEP